MVQAWHAAWLRRQSGRQEEADQCLGLELPAGRDQHVLTRAPICMQLTLWNFLKYNVMGGGDSALYGVESTTFYLRNALTNLNLVLPLALLVPLSALFLMSNKRGDPAHPPLREWLGVPPAAQMPAQRFVAPQVESMSCKSASHDAQACLREGRHLCKGDGSRCCMACPSADGWLCAAAGAGVRIRLAIAVAPVWVWGAVISALPHKEERFLYPVYPLVGTLSHKPGGVLAILQCASAC